MVTTHVTDKSWCCFELGERKESFNLQPKECGGAGLAVDW